MLNRNDLAKQFELVVKQEIKNHNDQMLATNISINEMKSSIAVLEQEIKRIAADLDSKIKNSDLQRESLASALSEVSHKSDSLANNLQQQSSSLQVIQKQNKENFCETDAKINCSDKNISDLTREITSISHNLVLIKCKNENDICDLKNLLSKKLDDVKKEILSQPSEAQEIKKEIEAKLSVDRVDFEGVMQELQIIKKHSYIQEKKIENLYTLIERLKEGSK